MDKSDTEVDVASAMGSSSGLKAPTGKVSAKKTGKRHGRDEQHRGGI
jgi:hypothetical protein